MHYAYEVVVLPSNLISNPSVTQLQFSAGVLKTLHITFPSGCADLVRCQVFDGATQIAPTNSGSFYAANNRTIDSTVYYDLTDLYNKLYLVAWNIGATRSHTLHLEADVQGPEEPDIGTMIKLLAQIMNRVIDILKGMY